MKKNMFLLPVLFLLFLGVTGRADPVSGDFLSTGKLNNVWVIIDQVSLSELEEASTPHLDYLQKEVLSV